MSLPDPARPQRFQSVARTHAGLRRPINEDRVLDRPGDGLWAVADGMGGHNGGEVAAERLIETLSHIERSGSGYARLSDLDRRVDRVNAELFGSDQHQSGRSTTGSTLVALLMHEGHFACVWAGDSRAYLWRDACLSSITRDHSVVQELVDGGAILEVDRSAHPAAHVITRAVGAAPKVDLDRCFASVNTGDVFLLCSDGLTACVDQAELAQAMAGEDLNVSADQLLLTVLDRGAPDNISFVVVRVED